MRRQSITMLTLAFALAVTPFAVTAHDGSDDRNHASDDSVMTTMTRTTETKVEDVLKQKREEAKTKIEDKRAEVTEKLDQKRKERCEKNESKINSIVDKRVGQLQNRLDKFTTIRARFEQFAATKQLTVENSEALVAAMDDKKAAAQAAIEAAAAYTFSCADAGATNPGGVAKSAVEAAKTALKDYRTAIKDYAKALKAAAEAAKPAEDTSSDGGTQ